MLITLVLQGATGRSCTLWLAFLSKVVSSKFREPLSQNMKVIKDDYDIPKVLTYNEFLDFFIYFPYPNDVFLCICISFTVHIVFGKNNTNTYNSITGKKR